MDKENFVTFYNGKSHQQLGRLPWRHQSYKNPISRKQVVFKNLPLCEEELGDEGKPVVSEFNGEQVLWGECLDFLASPSKQLILHRNVHYYVIQAIRDWGDCVSTKKSKGIPKRTNGRLIEYEPEVLSAKKKEEVDTKLAVMKAITALNVQKDTMLKGQIASLLGLNSMAKSSDLMRSLIATSEMDAKLFLSVISYDEEGKVVLSAEDKNKAIVITAIQAGVISNNGGSYFVDGVDLGTKRDRIHIDHANRLALIQQSLEDKQFGA